MPRCKKPISKYIIFGLMLFAALLLYNVSKWYSIYCETSLNEFLYTITSPIKNSNPDLILHALKYCLPPILSVMAAYIILVILDLKLYISEKARKKIFKTENKVAFVELFRKTVCIACASSLIVSISYTVTSVDAVDYVKNQLDKTLIYDEYYVDPTSVSIENNGKPQNLIYIYLESMETAYSSSQEGGIQPDNLIPHLTKYAKENTSFSNTDRMGGAYSVYGTTWTMGAILASSSGIPYAFPIFNNAAEEGKDFAPGLTALGDILNSKGYNQEFLCGSDSVFGGRREFFTQHGNYKIFDYYTAIEEGYIPEDYFVWWGFEDKVLYEIAKDEITKLAKQDRPFNFTMLTADTHFIDGYVCEDCPKTYQDKTGNIISCTDNRIYDFIEWCKKQDFYDNTTIVITGDHPRMDSNRVGSLGIYSRNIYNCFINPQNDGSERTENRLFSQMDMLPTVLSAMGYKIEGNRLGLGTDLFSEEPTIIERKSLKWFNAEISKSSDYYVEHFANSKGESHGKNRK